LSAGAVTELFEWKVGQSIARRRAQSRFEGRLLDFVDTANRHRLRAGIADPHAPRAALRRANRAIDRQRRIGDDDRG